MTLESPSARKQNPQPRTRMEKETARIEAFSDGVFAIAITLLILEIKIPGADAPDLGAQLARQWPSYVAFVISFLFIGIMWINHHRLFTQIKRADNTLLVLNLLLLLGVTSVPFPTAVLARHLGQSGERAAMILYNATYLVIAIFFNVLWRYSVSKKHHLLGRDFDQAEVEKISAQYALGPMVYLACLILARFSVTASLLMNIALAIYFLLPPARATKVARSPD
jgi:uncharacterized membrane protein